MKKIILLFTFFVLGTSVAFSKTTTAKNFNLHHNALMDSSWTKSATGMWTAMNNNKKVWYKFNSKNATLWWSTSGKTWAAVMNGMWQDKDGKWLKIVNKKLMTSADLGKTWTEVSDSTWKDADGNWCKFDSDWNLWTKKGS